MEIMVDDASCAHMRLYTVYNHIYLKLHDLSIEKYCLMVINHFISD